MFQGYSMSFNSKLNKEFYNYQYPMTGVQFSTPANFQAKNNMAARISRQKEQSIFSLKNIAITGVAVGVSIFSCRKDAVSKSEGIIAGLIAGISGCVIF